MSGEYIEDSEDAQKLRDEISTSVSKRIIEHRIKIDDGNEGRKDKDLERTLKEKDEQLQRIAENEFQKQKGEFIEKVKTRYGEGKANDLEDKINSGYDLSLAMEFYQEEEPSTSTRKRAVGKIRGQKPKDTKQSWSTTGDMIDDIYENLERQKYFEAFPHMDTKKEYDPAEKRRLQKMADELLSKSIEGMRMRRKIVTFEGIWTCPECGASNMTNICGCGYTNKMYRAPVEGDIHVRRMK